MAIIESIPPKKPPRVIWAMILAAIVALAALYALIEGNKVSGESVMGVIALAFAIFQLVAGNETEASPGESDVVKLKRLEIEHERARYGDPQAVAMNPEVERQHARHSDRGNDAS